MGRLPEEERYQDTGCALAPSCLNCPFDWCIKEEPWGRRRYLIDQRNDRILADYLNEDITQEQLAKKYNLNVYTIGKALSEAKDRLCFV